MSINELLAEASKMRGWKLVCGAIRRSGSEGNYLQCPITAVARAATGKIYFLSEYRQAGRAIGLDKQAIRQITSAADDDADAPPDVRQKLLARLIRR
jgi:hypothetical protein